MAEAAAHNHSVWVLADNQDTHSVAEADLEAAHQEEGLEEDAAVVEAARGEAPGQARLDLGLP